VLVGLIMQVFSEGFGVGIFYLFFGGAMGHVDTV
jgi:hypothetical protein